MQLSSYVARTSSQIETRNSMLRCTLHADAFLSQSRTTTPEIESSWGKQVRRDLKVPQRKTYAPFFFFVCESRAWEESNHAICNVCTLYTSIYGSRSFPREFSSFSLLSPSLSKGVVCFLASLPQRSCPSCRVYTTITLTKMRLKSQEEKESVYSVLHDDVLFVYVQSPW